MDVVQKGAERCIREGPEWLDGFLSCDYFSTCLFHKSARSARNHFCVDCNQGPICTVGLESHHRGHKRLQIRKASHHDAIKVLDIQNFIDISQIQCYSINADKIVFLIRPKAKLHQGRSKRSCINCKRALNDEGMLMCSIKCKLNAVRNSLLRQDRGDNGVKFDNPVISLDLGKSSDDRERVQVNHTGDINSTSCCDGNPLKRRKIDNHVMVQGPDNNLSMEEEEEEEEENIHGGSRFTSHNGAICSADSPNSVLRADSPNALTNKSMPDSSNHGCHCGEEKRTPEFQVSPPPAMEDGELTSSEQCKDEHKYHHQNRRHRRKGIPIRSPFF